jgi:hypothetical protein
MLLWGVFDLLLFAVSLLVCYVALTYLKVGAGGAYSHFSWCINHYKSGLNWQKQKRSANRVFYRVKTN